MWAATAKAKKKIPLVRQILGKNTRICWVKRGSEITITHGRNCAYALWHGTGIYDLDEEYVSDIKVFCDQKE